MPFDKKLNQMCIAGDSVAKRELGLHTKSLAHQLAAVLKFGRWSNPSVKATRALNVEAESACDAAELGDAAEFVNTKLLSAKNGTVIDLKVPSEWAQIQDDIEALFESGEAKRRGFVYVAWTGRPERFMYVGSAKQASRLNLVQHGKLSHALAHVSTLTLLFPTQSKKAILLGLEGSVIRLIEHVTGRLPELNDRRETVPVGSASEGLRQLAQFLSSVADKVRAVE